MRIPVTLVALAAAVPLGACSTYGNDGGLGGLFGSDGYAERTYRDDYYQERQLSDNDVIYRGRDGRYYCRRENGTTGLVVGGLAGGVLGNIIAPGGSKTLGTLLGAGAGALAGREIDRSDARCR